MFPQGIRVQSLSFAIFVCLVAVYLLGVIFGLSTEIALWGRAYLGAPFYAWLTHAFIHGGPAHIIMNSIVLFQTGPIIEARLSAWKFLTFSLIGAVLIGWLACWLHFLLSGDNVPVIGYSGVLFAYMGGLVVIILRKARDKKRAIAHLIRSNMILVGYLILPFFISIGVSAEGHLLGFIFGLLAFPLFWRSQRSSLRP